MKRLLTLSLLALALTGCGISTPNSLPVFYTPAIMANDISYLPKPLSADSINSQNYLSASFSGSNLPKGVASVTMGFVNYNRAHTFKNFNIAYGTFAFFGGTNDGDFDDSRRELDKSYLDKSFYGAGLRTSIGVFETSGNTEFRILNWESTLSFEGGNYSSLRKRLRDDTNLLSVGSNKTTLFTTGGASEIIWRGSRNTQRNYGFRIFIGSTIGLKKNINYTDERIKGLATDFSFFLKIKRAYAVFSNSTNLEQYGNKITLGYAF